MLIDVGVSIVSTVSVESELMDVVVSIVRTVSVDGCGCLYCKYSQC